MVPSGLALGINKQTWKKNDSYNNLTIKSRSGGKKMEKMVQGLASFQCRGYVCLVPKLKMMFGFEWGSCW